MEKKEKQMEEKKKSKKGIVLIILGLIIIILGLVGYICYDKGLIFKSDKDVVEVSNNSNKEQKLDVNSRLVQTLYGKVTTGDGSCVKNWIYGDEKEGVSNPYKDEFDVKTATEQEKMRFVGKALTNANKEYIDCETTKIPDTMKEKNAKWGHSSICSMMKQEPYSTEYESAYSKKYMELLYKSIFGKDAELDTSASVMTDQYGIRVYYYLVDLNKYVAYGVNGGGTCGPQKYEDTIESAILKGKTLKIREKEVYSEEGKKDTTTYYIYTFERESDGMYKFISRKKEK